MTFSIPSKKIAHSYLLISILFFGYNMLQLPKMPYFALRLILMLIITVYVFKIIKYNIRRKPNMRLFLCYFAYLCFSFLLYLVYGFPISLLPEAVMDGLFPMIFFFTAFDEKEKTFYKVDFYKYYYWGAIFLYVCSIYLFMAMPSWYIDWKVSMQPDEWKNNLQVMGTMSGFSGSGYLVGYTSFFAFCYLIFKFKVKVTTRNDIVCLFIVLFCMLFSQVRVTLLTSVALLLWYFKESLSFRTIIIFLVAGISVFFIFSYFIGNSDFLTTMFDIYTSKLENTSEDTRWQTGLTLLSQQTNFLFGHGYGTGGNMANRLGLPSVTDAEYFKLFYETGIVGFVLFIGIIVKTLCKIVVNKSKYLFELFIICFYLLAMLIADPLSLSPMLSHVFWYALGRVLL